MATRAADDRTAQRDGAAATRPHRVSLEVLPPLPAELPVGTSVSFKVRVAGTDRDLRGARVEVVASEYLVATPALAEHGDGFTESAAIAVRAPARPNAGSRQLRPASWLIIARPSITAARLSADPAIATSIVISLDCGRPGTIA